MSVAGGPAVPAKIDKSYRCIYPIYLDKSKSVREGRKISANESVDKPTLAEIVEAATLLYLRVIPEVAKRHPADYAAIGRARVQHIASDGKPYNPSITTHLQAIREIAKKIPELKSRKVQPTPAQGGKKK